jgi:hypothetical protein
MRTSFKDNRSWTLKKARKLLPHRSDSGIQDWVEKGIVACQKAEGTGHSHQFDKYELLHLMVCDQMSALGLFAKPYRGENIYDRDHGTGNVIEVFHYPNQIDVAKRIPKTRNPLNAIEFYRLHEGIVIIAIDVMRSRPHLDSHFQPVERTVTAMRKAKVGQIYYWVSFFQDTEKLFIQEVDVWHRGNAGKGDTLGLISVTHLRNRLESALGIQW